MRDPNCRKRAYRSIREAIAVLRSIKRRSRRFTAEKRPVRPYLCDVCQRWHLTSIYEETAWAETESRSR